MLSHSVPTFRRLEASGFSKILAISTTHRGFVSTDSTLSTLSTFPRFRSTHTNGVRDFPRPSCVPAIIDNTPEHDIGSHTQHTHTHECVGDNTPVHVMKSCLSVAVKSRVGRVLLLPPPRTGGVQNKTNANTHTHTQTKKNRTKNCAKSLPHFVCSRGQLCALPAHEMLPLPIHPFSSAFAS